MLTKGSKFDFCHTSGLARPVAHNSHACPKLQDEQSLNQSNTIWAHACNGKLSNEASEEELLQVSATFWTHCLQGVKNSKLGLKLQFYD